MKALVFHTHTVDCQPKILSLAAAGIDYQTMEYDSLPHEQHGQLIARAREMLPDFMVVIGAIEEFHRRPVPKPDIYRNLRNIGPVILMCCDSTDHPWHSYLHDYHQRECFDLFVNIDGGSRSPISHFENGITLLSPVDSRPYFQFQKQWADRNPKFCFIGGVGGIRGGIVNSLKPDLLDHYQPENSRSYDEVARMLCERKHVVNSAWTGTGQHMHVKGRVVEAGFAGCMLFETRGSPTGDWFVPDLEYFPFDDPIEIRRCLQERSEDDRREIAERFQKKVIEKHHPSVFWNTVLSRIGFDVG